MHPHPIGRDDYQYPYGGLLQVDGVLTDNEIKNPKQLDAGGKRCRIVCKNGRTSGTTFGRLSGLESFVRSYPEYGIKGTSIELAVYSYINEDGAFSTRGDSGSIVVDYHGRIAGLLVGGAEGVNSKTDVTYLTPYWWIERQMKLTYPNISLYPVVA